MLVGSGTGRRAAGGAVKMLCTAADTLCSSSGLGGVKLLLSPCTARDVVVAVEMLRSCRVCAVQRALDGVQQMWSLAGWSGDLPAAVVLDA